jgi:hypothetical protein
MKLNSITLKFIKLQKITIVLSMSVLYTSHHKHSQTSLLLPSFLHLTSRFAPLYKFAVCSQDATTHAHTVTATRESTQGAWNNAVAAWFFRHQVNGYVTSFEKVLDGAWAGWLTESHLANVIQS